MDGKFKVVGAGALAQNMLQHSAASHLAAQLTELAAKYPDYDVQIYQDEVMLVAKNENQDLQKIGERIHAAAEGMVDAVGAREQRELQMWHNWAAGWKPGVQGLLDMANNQRHYDFYTYGGLQPRLVKTKKGPRRYRVQMVHLACSKGFLSRALIYQLPGSV